MKYQCEESSEKRALDFSLPEMNFNAFLNKTDFASLCYPGLDVGFIPHSKPHSLILNLFQCYDNFKAVFKNA